MKIREIIKEELSKLFKEEFEVAGTQNEVPMIVKSPKGYHLGMAEAGVNGSMVVRSIESPAFKGSAEVCKFYSNWDKSTATMGENIVSEDGGRGYSVVGDPQKVCGVNEDNLPAGAQFDTNAPYNKSDNTRPGSKSDVIKYSAVWYDTGIALLKDVSGNLYVFDTDSVEMDEYEPYADREETFEGFDEEGDPILEYGDWEMNGEVVENYVNDNLEYITIGKGISAYESGEYNMAMIDDELRQDLMGMAPYIKLESDRKSFLEALGGVNEGIEKIVDKKTMDTPTGSLFIGDVGASGE